MEGVSGYTEPRGRKVVARRERGESVRFVLKLGLEVRDRHSWLETHRQRSVCD